MRSSANDLPCDGCGLPASPEHIAQRLRRLEFATQFRPVHIGILFVTLAPPARAEDDFYAGSESQEFGNPFLDALDIQANGAARLVEFQRRGYFLASLSECPIPQNEEPVASTIDRLGPTLIRRIRFNYKPKLVALLGQELSPLVDALRAAGIGPLLTFGQGQLIPTPRTGDREWLKLFQRAVSSVAPGGNLPVGYDRIQLTQSERDLGAGGGT